VDTQTPIAMKNDGQKLKKVRAPYKDVNTLVQVKSTGRFLSLRAITIMKKIAPTPGPPSPFLPINR
jgi:hypothetical protein